MPNFADSLHVQCLFNAGENDGDAYAACTSTGKTGQVPK